MISGDNKGINLLSRDRNWKSEERLLKKQKTKRNWYKNKDSKHKSALFVPPTPGCELIKRIGNKRRRTKQKYR